jgi:flavin-dependent dehydrogenase
MVNSKNEQETPSATGVFIVGGGPAGLAAAIAARQRGFEVLVADGNEPPIDKACGEGFLPDGLTAMERLGIHVPVSEGRPFCGIRFLSRSLSAEALFPSGGTGLALRRTSLHRLMVERAEQLGATLLWRTPVTGISENEVHLSDRIVRARWIIGADGSNSRVRRWAGLDHGRKPRLRYAFRRHYRVAAWTDHVEVYWGDRCQGYMAAVGPDQVCVALASHNPNLRLEEGLKALPRLEARLQDAGIISSERGALTGNRSLDRVWRGNVALIGDASGTVDAITGEGIGLAFSQAVALAASLESGNLAIYQNEHRKLVRRPLWMAWLMLNLDGRPHLQQRTLQVFQKRPELFRQLLALHIGALPPLRAVKDGLSLGWGLLTA